MSQPISLQRQTKPATGYTPSPMQAGGQPYPQQTYGAPTQQGQYPPQQGQYGAPPSGQYGQPPMGSQPGMQQPMGQPGMGQPGMGQPGMGQAGMGQPGMGQPPMGSQPGMQQPMGGQPPMGQYGAPPAGAYGQPGMQQPMGGQPPVGQYGAPPAGQYGAPPSGQYGQQPVMGRPPMGGQPGVISLVKGQNMSLTKVAPNLRHARIGLGWDVRQSPGAPFDLDTSVFLLNGAGKVSKPQDFIFYNNKQSMDGSVMHHGDNLTGAGEGDDEQVSIDLTRLSPEIQRVVVVCSIYEAEQRQQNFGMVQRAFIRVVDQDVNQEVVRFDLTEEACMASTMVFGELYRYGPEWKFKALGTPMQGGLRQCGNDFGITLG